MTNDDTRFLQLKDGRILSYATAGDPQGYPVFYMHSSPGSRLEVQHFAKKAADYGLLLIAADRPGMGQTTYQNERRLLDWPSDIAQLAAALSLSDYGLMGWSGGAAYALACAYALADQARFAITLAGFANLAEVTGAEQKVMTRANGMSVYFSQKFPRQFGTFFDLMALNLTYLPEQYYQQTLAGAQDLDQLILTDPLVKELYMAGQAEGFAGSGRGATRDAELQYEEWGFDLAEVKVPVYILHGTADELVMPEFAEHLAANLPQATLRWVEGQGHFFPVIFQDLIFETAVGAAKEAVQ